MRSKPFLLFILLLSSSALTQETWPEADIRVKGIGAGSSYSQLLRKIGRPLRTVDNGIDECGDGGKLESLVYRGLTIGLLSRSNGRNFSVMSIEITARPWSIQHGIKIGSARKAVIAKMGKPIRDDEDAERLLYVTKGNLGTVAFLFKENSLITIRMHETLC